MPTVLIEGYQFRFYSSDRNEPPHVHVLHGGNEAKVWLQPVVIEHNHGYNDAELNRILKMTRRHQNKLLEAWNDYLVDNTMTRVGATAARFIGNVLSLSLNDGRELNVPIDKIEWLSWLKNATAEQRSKWSIEPGGFAIYWEELDDGIEICHLLDMQPLA